MKKHKIDRFILISFTIVILLCISIIVVFAVTMSRRSNEAITKISVTYMDGMNDEIASHFKTTVDLRMNQIETIIDKNPPQKAVYGEEMMTALEFDGKARNFPFLSLMSTEGEFETIYGEDLEPYDPQSFIRSLNNDEKKAALAHDASGKRYILLGISTIYPMGGGKKCTGLVGALPVEYFNNTLSLDNVDNMLIFSNVITNQGKYIIKNYDDEYENYFERIRHLYKPADENNKDSGDLVEEISDAMHKKEKYSAVFSLNGKNRHLFCSPLPESEWYLVTIMPYGTVEEVMNDLGKQRVEILGVSIVFIAIIFAVIFFLYYNRTLKQHVVLEQARNEAVKASRAKSEFLSNMSHDIRTPMNAIVGMTSIAMANLDNKPTLEKCLKNISKSNKHLLGLINDVLDMSKIENGKLNLNMEKVSLREVMNDIVLIVQPQIKEKKQSFDIFVYDIISEEVISDSIRLNRVMLNLMSNAIKFTPENGRITITLYQEPSPLGEEHIRVHINVKDNGIGMTEDFRKIIFDSFSREDSKRVHKTEGTGLGMAITKYIVDAMQGTIEVKSAPGKGSEFKITIDMERADIPDEEMNLPKLDVLIVDDDEMICTIASENLTKMGSQVDYTLSGEQAVKMAEKKAYDVILVDWQMPELDGIETAKRLRDIYGKKIPIIVISAYDWNDIEAEAYSAGVSGFIPKPLFKSTLYRELKKYLDKAEIVEEKAPESRRDFTGTRLLVAEDNDLNWEVANELLSQFGFELDHAENGSICAEMFEKSKPGYYLAILMDVRMPVMNGYESTEKIRSMEREDSDIPIFAMTADAFADDIKKCLDCGMNGHIAKPIDVSEIIRRLESLL